MGLWMNSMINFAQINGVRECSLKAGRVGSIAEPTNLVTTVKKLNPPSL